MTTNVALRRVLTRSEVADVLRGSTKTVDRLVHRGALRPVRLVPGGRPRFRVEDIERLLEPDPPEPHPVEEAELEWR